jgi:cobalamin biosynthesis Mg chelatase CobN
MLDATSWVKKSTPVFSQTSEVYGPGHASFTKSPDGTEDWIVYHSKKNTGWNWDRQVSAQKFTWNANDEPVFGSPVALGIPIQEPSGTMQTSTSAPTATAATTASVTSSAVVSTSKSGSSTSMVSSTTAEATLQQGWSVSPLALLAVGALVLAGVVIIWRVRFRRKE